MFYSTSVAVNELFSDHLRVPILQSAELDDNKDGVTDRIELGLIMPLEVTERITKFSCLIYHDVELKDKARYRFDAGTYITADNAVPMGNLYVDGDINIRQTWPLDVKGGYHIPYSSEPLIETSGTMSASHLHMAYILGKMAARNLSTVFAPTYIYSVPSMSGRSVVDASVFNASIVLRIPRQPIRYTPGASEVLKFAWIQYMCFFVVIAFVMFRLNAFVFRHQLVYAYGVSDIVVEKMD